MSEGMDQEVEKIYREDWKEIIEPNGALDFEQVKKELYDFSMLIQRFQAVINIFGATKGISKLTYKPEVYVQALEEYVTSEIEEALYDKEQER